MSFRTGGVLAVLVLMAVGCSSDSPSGTTTGSTAGPGDPPAAFERVVVRHSSDYDTLDMHKTKTGPNTGQVGRGLYDRLVAVGAGGSVVPYLATSWEVAPGAITFEVRTDATCADGTPVTAEVIANSLRRTFDPATEALSPPAEFGPGPYSVSVDDDTHVTVTIEGSQSTNLVAAFVGEAFSIYCPAGLEPDADFDAQSYGSGAYTLVSAAHGDRVVMRLRPEWTWGPEGTTSADLPQELVIRFVSEDTTAANMLLAGELDVASISGADIGRLAGEDSLDHIVGNSGWATMLWLNQSEGKPGADPAVREALMTAIDREAWNVGANNGLGALATSLVAPDVPCYDDAVAALIPAPSLDAAAGVLEAAGYAKGGDGIYAKDGQAIEVRLISRVSEGAGPDYITDQWTKLGVRVTLAKTADADWISAYVGGEFDAATHTNVSPADIPLKAIDAFIGASPDSFRPTGSNAGRIVNVEAAEAARTAKTTTDDDERCEAIKTLQRSVMENFDILPLVYKELHWFTRGVEVLPAQPQGLEIWTIRKKS